MACSDNSSFLGVSLNDIFATGPEPGHLGKKTSVAVIEIDGETGTFLETNPQAVVEKVRKANRGQDGETVCEADIETLRERDPKENPVKDPWQKLDDNEFRDRLEHWECSTRVTERTVLISYESALTTQSHGTLTITKELFKLMCHTLKIPAIFVKAVFATPWKAHTCGQAYFVESNPETDKTGKITGVTIFYHFQSGLQFGRSYVFTRYNFETNTSTNVCINCVQSAQDAWGTLVGPLRAKELFRSPFSFHIMLLHHIHESLDLDAEELRTKLLVHEDIQTPPADLALATWDLHRLAQDMHILGEYYADTEAKLEFLMQAYGEYGGSSCGVKTSAATIRQDLSHLKAMRWETSVSRRWVVDYKDRVNIRINHVFHVSNQEQAISMGTVAAVTLFFLPPTFVCGMFSMDFVDVWGAYGFKMSSYWWLYPATAVPLTVLVIVIWLIWRRFRNVWKSRCVHDNDLETGTSLESLGSVTSSESVESMMEKEKVT